MPPFQKHKSTLITAIWAVTAFMVAATPFLQELRIWLGW